MVGSRLLLLGIGPTTLSALESLVPHFALLGVVRDRKVVAGAPEHDPVIARAHDLGVPCFADTTLAAVAGLVRDLRPDCVVISSYNRIIGPELLKHCPFVNVHYAPLPAYRGRANVNWAIINGESEAAISIHTVAAGLDAGNILFQQRRPIGPDDTIGDLYAALNELQRQYLGATIARFLSGYQGEPQDESQATYGCTRIPQDGEIDWGQPTAQIYALIRGLAAPYPGAFSFLHMRRLRIWRATPVTDAPRYVGRIAGRVVGRSRAAGSVDVLTGDGILRLYEVQFDSGDPLPAAQAITSTRETLGLRTSDLLERIAQIEQTVARIQHAPAADNAIKSE